jgi:hypothetical protein
LNQWEESALRGHQLQADRVTLAVTEVGGHLSGVQFLLEGQTYIPLHTAPWSKETLGDDIPPMIQVLRGDFFCAPFADNDIDPAETRPHGASANDRWDLIGREMHEVTLRLAKPICGATLEKRLVLRPGHAVIYQQHRFTGGNGTLPVGHHLMVRAPGEKPGALRLGFSPHIWAASAPSPVEPDPQLGRSLLAYPQLIEALTAVKLASGDTADLTHYPWGERHEDIIMLSAQPERAFAWTTVTAAEAGWVLFALKRPDQLASTLMWMSNGGRDYAPWNGRHVRVLGLEEVTSYFHLGHAASLAQNPVNDAGIPTAITLQQDHPTEIRYAFGLAACPANFGRVVEIVPVVGGIRLIDESGATLEAAVDLNFITQGSG